MQEADSSLIIIYKATLVRIANKCFLHDPRVRRENRKCASLLHDGRGLVRIAEQPNVSCTIVVRIGNKRHHTRPS